MKRATVTVIGLCIALSILNLLPIGSSVTRTNNGAKAQVVLVAQTLQPREQVAYDTSALKSAVEKKLATNYSVVHWVLGFSVQNGWLCYGWGAPSWVYHCTLSWHYVNGKAVSLNPAFVPLAASASSSNRSTSAPSVNYVASSSSGGWSYKFLPGEFCDSLDFGNQAYISQWSVPPSCYSSIYYPNPNNYSIGYNGDFGWCNWIPQALRPQYPTIWDDPNRGGVPRPGATIFYSGDVQGASSDGHYGVVVAVSPDGYWVLTTEMNFYWRGGGWQKVDYRYIHVGWGVTFLY